MIPARLSKAPAAWRGIETSANSSRLDMRLADIDLTDPDVFQRGTPHEMFRVLRRESPVHWHEEKGGPGFWAITKYEDVKFVSKRPDLFSSERQGTMLRDPSPTDLPYVQ